MQLGIGIFLKHSAALKGKTLNQKPPGIFNQQKTKDGLAPGGTVGWGEGGLSFHFCLHCFSSVQFSSVAQSCPTLCNPLNRSTPGLPVHHQLLEFTQIMSIKSVMPSSHLILCCPFLLLPPIPPSIRVFSNESTLCMRWPKYWSFSFSSSPSNEHPGQFSFRMDWLDLLAV